MLLFGLRHRTTFCQTRGFTDAIPQVEQLGSSNDTVPLDFQFGNFG